MVDAVVAHALARAEAPVLLVSDLVDDPAQLPDGVTLLHPAHPRPEGRARTVVAAFADVAALREWARAPQRLGKARHVVCTLRVAEEVLPLRPHPEWPTATALEATLAEGGAVTRVELAAPHPATEVLVRLARTGGHLGLRVARETDERVPPDVVRAPHATPEVSEILGRAPVVMTVPDGLLDETVLNPVGFPREADGPVIELPPDTPVTADAVGRLRRHEGVRVPDGADPRLVAALAMAGTPLVGGEWGEPDLSDPITREEHSVRLRRRALREGGLAGWRRATASSVGARVVGDPSVSVLMPTRRPEQLRFALRHVARQRDVTLELVLATHGFTPDAGEVADLLDGLPHVVVPVPPEAVLGEVLQAATAAASGDVVMKMDDDDWYGPDVVADLLLARRYARADLVGMPAEFVYLEGRDVTVRRRGPSENHGRVVAGGTLLLDRTLLRELGGFAAVGVEEDARLFRAVLRAGGAIYRTQGLGYVLRRRTSGHTWQADDDYFLRPDRVTAQWSGFRPSALVEVES